MRRVLTLAVGWARQHAIDLARGLLGSRRTRRFIWAQWMWERLRSLAPMRRLYRRVNVEWDLPGHGRAVTSDIMGPGPHQVLVRAMASAVSPGKERAHFRRESSTEFPMLPGSSLAGELVRVGKSVSSVHVGQLVATEAPHVSLVVRPADLVFPLPTGVDTSSGAFLLLGMTAVRALRYGELHPRERVAVVGLGAIGQLVVQVARALGASEVESVAPSVRLAGRSLRQAATRVLATADVAEALDTVGADLTIDATGADGACMQAIRATRSGGRVVLLGMPHMHADIDRMAAEKGVMLLDAGSPEPESPGYREDAQTFLGLLGRGAVDVGDLIGMEVNPWEAGRFYRRLAGHRLGSVTAVFRWDLLSDEDRMRAVRRWEPPDTELARGMTMKSLPTEAMLRPSLGSRPGA